MLKQLNFVKYPAMLVLLIPCNINGLGKRSKVNRCKFGPKFCYAVFTPSSKLCQNLNAWRPTEGEI